MERADIHPRSTLATPALALLAVGLLCVVVGSLLVGPKEIDWHGLLGAWLGGKSAAVEHDTEMSRYVLFHLRLPRALLAIAVGVSLAAAGTVLQALWRNALADAGLLGIHTAAALGAAAALFGFGHLPLFAMLPPYLHMATGALVTSVGVLALLYRVSQRDGGTSLATLLLLGIAVNAAGSGILGLVLFWASDSQLRALTFWTLGSVAGASWPVTIWTWLMLVSAAPLLWSLRRGLDALLLGEENAFYLGWHTKRLKRVAIWSAATLVAVAVSAAGPIAFVGLIVPHVLRLVVGPSHAALLPLSAVGGGTFVLGCDLLARSVASPAELPLSVVTAGLGGPVLLALLLSQNREGRLP